MVCDYTGISEKWLDKFIIKENLEVIATVSPQTDENYFISLLKEIFWEYLLIFENGMRNEFEELIKTLNISKNRVVYALDENSWAENPAATFALLNRLDGTAYRRLTFNIARQLNYFMAVTTVEGLHYVATSKDDAILGPMYTGRKNYSERTITLFHELVKKFYDINDSSGWFLDIGANIGTTGIYFLKKLTPKLKLLAFEPDKENFKLLRANLILNDVENYVAENYGLGDVESEMTSYHIDSNPSGSGIFANLYPGQENSPAETVKIIPLDNYFAENKLNPKDVKYIWIDTEGFEAKVLLGAQNLLAENPAPIFMEFRPGLWCKMGFYKKMIKLLMDTYSGYICAQEKTEDGKFHIHAIEELWNFESFEGNFNVLGDIFLIHKL